MNAIDEVIATLAATQRGVVTLAQLRASGVKLATAKYRLRAGYLQLVHRGLYRVGSVVDPYGREMAALLACGNESMLCHGSASALWRLAPRDELTPVAVTVTGPGRRRIPGIVVHRTRCLGAAEATERSGLRVTSPARTLLDLAGTIPMRDLERAVAVALREPILTSADVACLLEPRPGRRGAAALRALLRDASVPCFTRSEAEERLLQLLRKGGLQRPETNERVAGYELDFLWRAERVVVEVDGHAYHASARNFESDRRRDADLARIGLQVMRVTWRQITREPEGVLVRLAQTLALRRTARDV